MAAVVGVLGIPRVVRTKASVPLETHRLRVGANAAIAGQSKRRVRAPGLAVGALGSRGHVAIKGPVFPVKVRRNPVAIAAARAERAMVAVVGADGRRAPGRGNVRQVR